jgi:hypothetical protein
MTKLCPRGKAAAKRKFKVYPSAYANAYASKICAGKIKDPSGVKRKDFRGPKPAKADGGMIEKDRKNYVIPRLKDSRKDKPTKRSRFLTPLTEKAKKDPKKNYVIPRLKDSRTNKAGGGVVEATRRLRAQGLKNGGVARGCGAIMSDRRKKTKIV